MTPNSLQNGEYQINRDKDTGLINSITDNRLLVNFAYNNYGEIGGKGDRVLYLHIKKFK